MHNKEYALKLVQNKLLGLNNYSYAEIANLSGYKVLQIKRFAKLLKKKDIDSILTHGLTNKPSNNSVSPREIEFIKQFKNQYPYISISQFRDIYHEDIIFNSKMQQIVKEYELKVRSYSFFKNLYIKFNWKSPINHKKMGKESEKHPLREPSPSRGILIMIDGTPHDWFGNGQKWSLHLAIDDATDEILCGWFMPTECLYGYAKLLYLLITLHGIPEILYSDRISILISPNQEELTQFGLICKDLGITQIAALSPEAKGKVERMNNTIQNRLLNDIKRYNIKTYEQLNEWFNSFYKNYINKKFAYKPKNNKSFFVPIGKTNLEYIFCTRYERKMLDGQVISYKNHYYKIIDEDGNTKDVFRGSSVTIYENIFNGNVYAKYYGKFYATCKIEDKITAAEKRRLTRIENQKQLEQVLKEREKRLKLKN